MKKKISVFTVGFLLNLLTRFIFLIIAGVILLIVGIWVRFCLYLGTAFLLIAALLALLEEITIIRTLCRKSDNPDFAEFQDAVLSEDSDKGIMKYLEDQIKNAKEMNDEGENR